MSNREEWKIVGVMSGSSLDGIDLALCTFSGFDKKFKWSIDRAETVAYDKDWINRLKRVPNMQAREFVQTDYDFGYLIGKLVKQFIGKEEVLLVASHGHTVFHQPETKMTCQIGHGAAIAGSSGMITISDFRSTDIGLGGQGAPITSMFDVYALRHYDMLLNLGGISNITLLNEGKGIQAFDIGPCNQLLNHLASQTGSKYDQDGNTARTGKVDEELLARLLRDPYFDKKLPKTLDNQYIVNNFISVLDESDTHLPDKLRTVSEMIAVSIRNDIERYFIHSKLISGILLTGGGANNTFLTDLLGSYLPQLDLVIPEKTFIDFKEALMIAFMGYLRINGMINVLSAVTGASMDNIGGAVYLN